MLNRIAAIAFVFCVFSISSAAQNKFEGHRVIVDVPTNQTATACAVRYVPPSTTITVTDLNSATPLKINACGGSGTSLVQSSSGSATFRSNSADQKWCFEGEDKRYRISFAGDKFSGPITYNWIAHNDDRTRGFYNLRDFGAVGDGVTDDTIALKSAVAFIASRNGGVLTVPEGDYVVSSPVALPSGLTIQGSNGLGSRAPTSDLARNNPTRITLKGTGVSLFRIGECTEKITITDIELYAQNNNGTTGIEGVGAYNSSQDFNVIRVAFNNFNRGIDVHGLPQTNLNWQFDYVNIESCRFIYNRDAGIYTNLRNTDWRINGTVFINPKKQPGQDADSMHFERMGAVVLTGTFGGGFPNAPGGTFLNILDSGQTTIIGSGTEEMTASIVYNGVENPNAGDYSHAINIVNSAFGDPIIFKARRTLVSSGSSYGPRTFQMDERVRVYSTGDRFCYDGYILGCRGAVKNNFDRATVVFMTGQPSEGSVTGHPTFFGTDVKFGSGVQFPTFPISALPVGSPNGSMIYCTDCRRSTTPCQAGGNGAPVMRVAGQWSCL